MAIAGIIGAIAGLLPSTIEAYKGYDLLDEAEKRSAELGDSPKFEAPPSQIAFEEGMRNRMGQNMPGYEQMRSDIDATTATGMGASARAAGSQVGALAGSNRALASRRKQLRQLGAANLQHQDTATAQYGEAIKSNVPYQTAEFEYNEWLPWQVKKNEIASIRGFGQQQFMTGMDTAAATGVNAMNLMDQNRYYNQQMSGMWGQPTQAQTTPYSYGAAGPQIQQMGMNQVQPAVNLGTNPY